MSPPDFSLCFLPESDPQWRGWDPRAAFDPHGLDKAWNTLVREGEVKGESRERGRFCAIKPHLNYFSTSQKINCSRTYRLIIPLSVVPPGDSGVVGTLDSSSLATLVPNANEDDQAETARKTIESWTWGRQPGETVPKASEHQTKKWSLYSSQVYL